MTKETIRREIEIVVDGYQASHNTVTAWRRPLVGFAATNDQLFERLREVVSPNHVMPDMLLPGARTVVAFFIPFDGAVVRSNVEGAAASETWARAYIDTNALIAEVGRRMQQGPCGAYHGVAVTPATHHFDPVKLISDWSHRHIAYIAGLGRFGVNHMLITASGCCGRFGSFVTSLELAPDPRPGKEACLYYHDGSCLECVGRCPRDALAADVFDRHACYGQCLENAARFKAMGTADVCGKCLAGVPCSMTDPVAP